MMNTRSKRPAGPAPKTPSPKRSAAKTDVDDSPKCVAAAAIDVDGSDDDRKIAATDNKTNEPNEVTLEIVPAVAGDDDDKTVVSGSNQSVLRKEFDTLRNSSPTASQSIMTVLRSIPSQYNIFDPPRGSVAFVVYSAFIYFSPVVMRVIRTAILWYEHEFNHLTSADWSADKITVIVADSTEDMMSHAYVRDRNIQFLSIERSLDLSDASLGGQSIVCMRTYISVFPSSTSCFIVFNHLSISAEVMSGTTSDVTRVTRQMLNRTLANRTIPKAECMVSSIELPLQISSEVTETINISGSYKITSDSHKDLVSQYRRIAEDNPELSLYVFVRKTINEKERKMKRKQSAKVTIIPHFVGARGQPKYPPTKEYAMATLIVHKPWQGSKPRKRNGDNEWIEEFLNGS